MNNLFHTDTGNGFPVVLIHGFCESHKVWEEFVKFLSPDYRIICVDLPGFGKSAVNETISSIDDFANEVKELLHQLQIKECILVGHSLGGYVSLAFAEKYPKMLKGLSLFNSTAFADSEEVKERRNRTIQFVEKHGVEMFASSFVPPLFAINRRNELKNAIMYLTEIASESSKEGVIIASKAMRERPERTDVLKKADYPVQFIIGKDDGAVTLERSLEQCHLPKFSQVSFLSDCGHVGMFEKKEETKRILKSFLDLAIGK